jgi:hypothetical protein|nr:hypothetical protein Q903MT_gene600 [Picea sitchensis]
MPWKEPDFSDFVLVLPGALWPYMQRGGIIYSNENRVGCFVPADYSSIRGKSFVFS